VYTGEEVQAMDTDFMRSGMLSTGENPEYQFDNYVAEESTVHYVLVLQSPPTLGFPTFNVNNTLCGFYQIDETGNNLIFIALAQYEPKGIEGYAKDIQSQYDRYRAQKSPCIVSRTDTVTLDGLREQTLLNYFQAQAQQVNSFLD